MCCGALENSMPPGGSSARLAASTPAIPRRRARAPRPRPGCSLRRARCRPRFAPAGRCRARPPVDSDFFAHWRKVPVGPFATVTSVRTPRASTSVRISRPAGSSPTVPSTGRIGSGSPRGDGGIERRARRLEPDPRLVAGPLREHVDEQLADRDESHPVRLVSRPDKQTGGGRRRARCRRGPEPRSALPCASR